MFYKIQYSKNPRKIHRKAPVLDSLFQTCNFRPGEIFKNTLLSRIRPVAASVNLDYNTKQFTNLSLLTTTNYWLFYNNTSKIEELNDDLFDSKKIMVNL